MFSSFSSCQMIIIQILEGKREHQCIDCMRGSRGGGGVQGENHKSIGFLSNTGPDP